jgi:hypothetical protein
MGMQEEPGKEGDLYSGAGGCKQQADWRSSAV